MCSLCVCVLDIDECKLQNGGCSHTCTNTPGGHTCACPAPLLLHSDNTSCVSTSPTFTSPHCVCVSVCLNLSRCSTKKPRPTVCMTASLFLTMSVWYCTRVNFPSSDFSQCSTEKLRPTFPKVGVQHTRECVVSE